MAKGLFSWLGFGKKNKEEKQETESLKNQEQELLKEQSSELETKEPQDIVTEPVLEASIEDKKELETKEPQDIVTEPVLEASIEDKKELETKEPQDIVIKPVLEAPIEDKKELEIKESQDAVTEQVINIDGELKESLSENTSDKESSKDESEQKVKKSFFERLKKTRDNLAYGLSALIVGKKIDDELYEDLETALLTADLGVETTEYVIEKLKEESKARELYDAIALKANLKKILTNILKPCEVPLEVKKNGDLPFVILMVGVNGAGKTTTIGKLALKFKAQGLKVMLGAGDTFRAAAVEQLKEWGKRTDVPVISQPTGSDSASVLFDALSSAKSKNVDVLICDTAGRLQNKDNLMEELKKIVRVMKKISEDVPHEVLLVLDSTTGQNAVSQMKLFSEAVQVTGLCLTKLDGSAKGGVVFALADKFKTPVRFVGIGEKTEDLRVFDVDNFVDALIGDNL